MAAEAPITASTTAAGALLETRAVTQRFGGLVAVDSVSLAIPRGRIASVIGPNGAGKTTLFNIIAGIYPPTEGEVLFDGEVVMRAGGFGSRKSLRPDQVMSLGIARTFQNIRLFANMTALDNVLVGMHTRMRATPLHAMLRHPRPPWLSWLRIPTDQEEERQVRVKGLELLDYVGLGGEADSIAKNLSYGDQRRLEIARALASEPKLLLLDEPTAGMNPQETAEMTTFIRRLRDDLRLTVLLIEHDMKVVMGISDQIAVLDHGVKIADGTPEEIRANPQVIEAYLGAGVAQTAEKLAARQREIASTTSETGNA